VTLRTRVLRPGRRVALLESVMESGGQEVLGARGWRIARSETPVIEPDAAPPDIPETTWVPHFGGSGHLGGYLSAVEWRFVSGGFNSPGPAVAWGRPLVPLVPGESLSPMGRALLLADSGSGISMALDPAKYLFINVDLTVALHRDPQGEWVLLDSATMIGGGGTGLTGTRLSDRSGVVGKCLQTLIVASL
jgi:hypothetical protein